MTEMTDLEIQKALWVNRQEMEQARWERMDRRLMRLSISGGLFSALLYIIAIWAPHGADFALTGVVTTVLTVVLTIVFGVHHNEEVK
jgi:hypothetical protein